MGVDMGVDASVAKWGNGNVWLWCVVSICADVLLKYCSKPL
jgi:hypothetical protein